MHCFTGGPKEAEQALELGLHLAFGGILTFPKADSVREAAALTPENRLLIGRLRVALWAVKDWTAEETETAMRAFADQNGLKFGAVAQPLRAALTGRTTSPGIFDVLAVLGRDESLARLDDQGPD